MLNFCKNISARVLWFYKCIKIRIYCDVRRIATDGLILSLCIISLLIPFSGHYNYVENIFLFKFMVIKHKIPYIKHEWKVCAGENDVMLSLKRTFILIFDKSKKQIDIIKSPSRKFRSVVNCYYYKNLKGILYWLFPLDCVLWLHVSYCFF